MSARRYNKGKIRHELIAPEALDKLAHVYTMGAEKYTTEDDDGSENWRKGMNWRDIMGSVKRHIQKFEKGEDFDYDWPQELLDKYGPTYHLANAAWGLFTLLSYYQIYPQGDNRIQKPQFRIGLDIDGVLADFNKGFLEFIGHPEHQTDSWDDPIFRDNFHLVKGNKDFWMSLEPLVTELKFVPSVYVTTRGIDTEVSQAWLDLYNFPKAPLYTVGKSKVEAVRGNCDIFIDDAAHNYEELSRNGIVCLLMTRPHNRHVKAGFKRLKDFNDFYNRFL